MKDVVISNTLRRGPATRRARADVSSARMRGSADANPKEARYGRHARGSRRSTAPKSKLELPWFVLLFVVSLIIPWIVPIGTLNMSVYRIVLLALLLPCLGMWLRGKAGPFRIADFALVLFSLWASLTLVIAHGMGGALEPAGILFIETMGPYLLARCYIRTADQFRNVVLLWSKLVILLAPFALYEWLTGSKPILSAFGAIFPTIEPTVMPRSGFWRVQGPFNHSIEFGLFCGSLIALYLVISRGGKAASRLLMPVAIGGTAILSFSSAPIAGLTIQAALVGWNWFLGQFSSRWKILWGLAFAGYLIVEFGSNQPPIQFYISHFTFDGQTGWYRLAIWEHGTASVANHPLFGIGLNEYVRPAWMGSGSVDNFWLVLAIRHGMPAVLLMMIACFSLTFAIAVKKGLDHTLDAYRIAYLICMASFFLVGCTIHFYGPIYVWFMFLLGSGAWMLDLDVGEGASPRRPISSRTRKRLSRQVEA